MTCKKCNAARETNGQHHYFDLRCLWCGARLLQRIGRLQITQEESVRRRRAVLADWVAQGHADAELRRLAKLGETPLAPVESLGKHRKVGG